LDSCKQSRLRACIPQGSLNRFLLDHRSEPGSHALAAELALGQLVLDAVKWSHTHACVPRGSLKRSLLDCFKEPGSRAFPIESALVLLVLDRFKGSRIRTRATQCGLDGFSLDPSDDW
jgi:hypothetical protein